MKSRLFNIILLTCVCFASNIIFASQIRLATFNCSFYRQTQAGLIHDLSTDDNQQAINVSKLISKVKPDILLLNEFDYDQNQLALKLFEKNYLTKNSIHYPYSFTAPVNTGIPTGMDLNNDGKTNGGADAYGYGIFPGQYGMVVLSKYPIVTEKVRTFQNFLWKDMPTASLPDDMTTVTPGDWFGPEELAIFRLSSKSHWDIPIDVNGTIIHILVSHPTPPVFDGPEDMNGKRNHDEIKFWADYISPDTGKYIYDDNKVYGGLKPNDLFAIMGDQNADPIDGQTFNNAIDQLLNHPLITDPLPSSKGAMEASQQQAGINLNHKNDPKLDTYQCDRPGQAPGNLRLDYVLVSKQFEVAAANVYWPTREGIINDADNLPISKCSDHHMVYVDVKIP